VGPGQRRVLHTIIVLAVTVSVLAGVVPRSASADPAEQLRIMPVGDSITAGAPNTPDPQPTYRMYLYDHLVASGLIPGTGFDLVGPYDTHPSTKGFLRPGEWDHDSLALSGRPTKWAMDRIPGEMRNNDPDVLLVLVGINDLRSTDPIITPEEATGNIETFITRARTERADVKIAVAEIPPAAGYETLVEEYNALLRDLVTATTTTISPVVNVDLYTGFDLGLYSYDGVHPNHAGDEWIAERFATVLHSKFGIGDPWGGAPEPIAPVTTITDGPSGTVDSADATFAFVADVGGASFECRLDAAAWASCMSPYEITGLGDGVYTFEVRATAAGLTGDPALRTWTVELPVPAVPPVTTITDGPSGTVDSADATFAFVADVGGASFECRLDAAAWASCMSPYEITGLGDGVYTFEVRATAAGLTGDPALRTWTVELPVPPVGPTPDARVPSGAVRLVADWNGDGIATPGWFYRSQWTILEQPGGPILTFNYGRATDIPVVGDWNGSGRQTVGVRRGNQWFLRNSNSSGPAQVAFVYGRATDIPVVGDWNASGRQTVGVRRGNQWFLRNSNSSGPGQVAFVYGRATDIPVVGDWNASGRQTVGVRRGNQWFLRNSNSSGPGQVAFAYGRATDIPVVGDWNASGQQTAGIVRGSAWLLRNANSTGVHDVDYIFR
jgi:hypothetical protein